MWTAESTLHSLGTANQLLIPLKSHNCGQLRQQGNLIKPQNEEKVQWSCKYNH